MKTALYSAIRPAEGQTVAGVIRKAAAIGITLVRFNGWTNEDLGCRPVVLGDMNMVGGVRRDEARDNAMLLEQVHDACTVYLPGNRYDCPHIIQTAEIPNGYIVA